MPRPSQMTWKQFLTELRAEFPDVEIRPDEAGLLHCEVGAFRRATEAAMDTGRLAMTERHFRFVERVRREADPELRNALDVTYLEDLAFGVLTPARHAAVRERMPTALRVVLIRHRPEWR